MRISDWSSDVCSSDLLDRGRRGVDKNRIEPAATQQPAADDDAADDEREIVEHEPHRTALPARHYRHASDVIAAGVPSDSRPGCGRSEEHTSELQSLMRISYAVFCLKKKKDSTLVYTRTTASPMLHDTQQTSNLT